jgi:cysteine-rich repeat protein
MCDSGMNNSDAGQCLSTCKTATCGDGLLWVGKEQCDDGPNNGNMKACKANCKFNVCGDGQVGPGEACDDGNANNNDGCTTACKVATCGDGIKAVNEECDDGNGINTDACLNTCKLAKCGDGFKLPAEECDDGNGTNTDACLNTCKNAKCGDNVVWAGKEQCDDGNVLGNDGCNPNCTKPKLVFLTSTSYNGNLGGLAGGDAKCQSLATAAALPGQYKAWLSNNTNTPQSRFTKSTTGYALTNGLEVAQTWADLVDGTIDTPININQSKTMVGQADVWTGTDENGQSLEEDCSGWTAGGGLGVIGYEGRNNATNSSWTVTGLFNASNCSTMQRLYCFQQ